MGIPKFFGWFVNNEKFNPAVIERIAPENIDIFAIDLNGLIHLNAQKTFHYGEFGGPPVKISTQQELDNLYQDVFRGVMNDVYELSNIIKPRESLILAVDGVAPQAKINQQRSRRYLALKVPGQLFDSNVITPGTDFMKKLDRYIRNDLKHIQDLNQRKIYDEKTRGLPPRIVYSSHLVPGEGEHKIADLLRETPVKEKKVIIHGADADLIMIYLLQLQHGWSEIYLLRDNTLNYQLGKIIDLKRLENILKQLYPQAVSPSDDFVIILYLLGNDFLPHFPIFERIYDALNDLIDGYQKFLIEHPNLEISDGSNIIWENFSTFLNYFSLNYNYNLLEKWALNKDNLIKTKSSIVEKCITQTNEIVGKQPRCVRTFDSNKFNEEWYKFIFSPKTGYGVVEITQEDKDEMSVSYLEGIAWVYNYYKNGVENVNKSWYYPYHYSPLFPDLAEKIKSELDKDGTSWEIKPLHLRFEFISPLEQMVMVLPPSSILVVPEPLRTLYAENSPVKDILPETFLTDPQGKMEDWQSIALLPIPNANRITRAILNLNLSISFLNSYANQEIYILRNLIKLFKTKRPRGRGVSRGQIPTRERGRGGPTRGRGVSRGQITTRGRGESIRGRGGRGQITTRGRGRGRGRGPSRGRGQTPQRYTPQSFI